MGIKGWAQERVGMDKRLKAETFFFSSFITIAFYIMNRLINIGRGVLFARVLGSEGYGYYSMSFFFVNLMVSVVAVGLPSVYLRYVPIFKEEKKLKFLVKNVHIAILVLFSFSSLLLFLFRKPVSILIFGKYIPKLFFITIILIGFATLFNSIVNLWAGLKRFFMKSLNMILTDTIWLVIIGIFWLLGGKITVNRILIFYGFVLFFIIITNEYVLWNRYLTDNNRESDIGKFWKRILSFSVWFSVVPILYQLFRYTDRIVITHLLDMSKVGIYSVGANLSMLIFGLGRSLNTVINPRLSLYWDRDDKEKMFKLFNVYLQFLSYFMIIMGFMVIVFKKYLIFFMFGQEYMDAVNVINYLVLFGIFNVLGFAVGIYLSIIEKTSLYVVPVIFSVLVNIVLNIYLIPLMGIKGASLATMITYFISFLITLILSVRNGFLFNKFTLFMMFFPFIVLCPIVYSVLAIFVISLFVFNKGNRSVLREYIRR